jgi:beta-galactosidase
LDLPHDWSIEGEFSDKNPATPGGGALPGGLGWYRKTFTLARANQDQSVLIDFDGVYRNSEVWINGYYLGKRPYGYSSFEYDLSAHLHFDGSRNVVAVKVDNSQQPNSRWYSGSGIYRNVWLTLADKVHVDHWGTFITTPVVSEQTAEVKVTTQVRNDSAGDRSLTLITTLYDSAGRQVGRTSSSMPIPRNSTGGFDQTIAIPRPVLWSTEQPYLYKAVSQVQHRGRTLDQYETSFGVRTFVFDKDRGFLLNGKAMKIRGVCDHHDLGSFGAAVNRRALERQLEMLKAMGTNGLRMSHNPPAPELLDLADQMGFVVIDEAFDMWKKPKTPFDYHLDWDQWHVRDLTDMILRDRNHPSVFVWSIGNEIPEQRDRTGTAIADELAGIVKRLDQTRPVIAACDFTDPANFILKSTALDLVGYNYRQQLYPDIPRTRPGRPFLSTETASALATRGSYDMPSDVIRRWPSSWDRPLTEGNADYSCSSYDNCSAPWGSTHEESWKVIKKRDFIAGLFIWTGWDYLGEPTPYPWPARSSYFGVIDLAGFPKDAYYLYQSEWTSKPVLHIFPYWNWRDGQAVDVWVYSNSDEVELLLNGKSLGRKHKLGDELHLMWRVPYEPGTLKAIARRGGQVVLTQEVRTAGEPARIVISPDRRTINADGKDVSFITVKVVDEHGTLVPHADNEIEFHLVGQGFIAGVDNGSQISHEPFKASQRKAFNGLCLAIIQANRSAGSITITATAKGLQPASATIISRSANAIRSRSMGDVALRKSQHRLH